MGTALCDGTEDARGVIGDMRCESRFARYERGAQALESGQVRNFATSPPKEKPTMAIRFASIRG
ncbi:hypothetical protein SAMN02990966_03652 [Rhodospirillales bacterium URHD0017]|nr:hypothetical protein SAMN02990966_03652 [Rhodospirillales bacterium URHD0017]